VSRTHQFLVTLTVHTNKINPATTPTTTSTTSMTNGHPVVVIQRDGQHRDATNLRQHVNALQQDLANPGLPKPLRQRIQTRLTEHQKTLAEHEASRPPAISQQSREIE